MSSFFTQIWQIVVDSNLLNVTGAILILLIGYLMALAAGRKSTDFIQRIAGKATVLPDGTVVLPVTRTAKVFGRVIYGIIMLLAVLGCLSVLKLDAAAAPLQEFITGITAYLPNIAGALLLFFIAWVLSELVKMLTASFLRMSKLGNKITTAGKEKCESEKFVMYISKTTGYIVYLFFLPAILNALKIYGITRPLQSMFEKFLTFIPNLAAAIIILFIGLWAANIARKAVKGLIVVSKVSDLTEKLDIAGKFRNGSISAMAGWTVYVLIALPVATAALTALNIDILSRAVAGFFRDILSVSGEIAASAVILFGAIVSGNLIARLAERFTAAWGVDGFFASLCPEHTHNGNTKPSVIIGKLAYIALIVLASVAVCDIMEFEKLATVIRRFAIFGGNIIISMIVLIIGIKLADIAAAMVKNKLNRHLENCVRLAVIIFTVALAISNLNIGSAIVEIAFAMLLGAFAVAAALAFGFGGREAAAKILARYMDKSDK